jgi:quercetin dioxygenase-like cupin family protein
MMFKEILQKLENAVNPVAQVVQNTSCSKVMVIAFKKGMILKEHKTDVPAKLLVIKGNVIYKEQNQQEELFLYDEKDIPVAVLHSVEAIEDSLCFLFKG